MNIPDLRARVERVMQEMEWRPVELARAAGCDRQRVNNWLNGNVKTMGDPQLAINIATASRKFSALWLLSGHGSPYERRFSDTDAHNLETLKNAPDDRKTALRLILPGLDI